MYRRAFLRAFCVFIGLAIGLFAVSSYAGQSAPIPKPARFRTLILTEEDGRGIEEFGHRTQGIMQYTPAGATFTYLLNAHGLQAVQDYTLLYLPDPWPGRGLVCLGTDTTNAGGALSLRGSLELNGDLPLSFDRNHPAGARIVLALTGDVDCHSRRMVSWDAANYLFGRGLILYHDTDYVADYNGTYCLLMHSSGGSRALEILIEHSGTTITGTVEGVTAFGTLSGQSASLTGTTPDGTFTLAFTFSDDGMTFSGTYLVGSEEGTLNGTKGACTDYVYPAGDPVCILPVPEPGLVTGGQQFNSVHDGVTHTGLDFEFATALPAVVAPCDGVITEINRHSIAEGNIIIDVVIKYNSDWTTFIAFEPYSPDPAVADLQQQIAVTLNQVVRRGDLLGHLVVPDPVTEFPHIHWGINRNDAERIPVCPRDYTTPEARDVLDALYGLLGLLPVCLP